MAQLNNMMRMGKGVRFAVAYHGDGKGIFKRIMRYLLADHKGIFCLACVLIVFSAVASIGIASFLGIFVDRFITPLRGAEAPDYRGFIGALCFLGGIYFVGSLSNFLYNRIMVSVAQGTLKRMRNEMFSHMQRLPLRFFDTNTHGDLMSCYTNDTDVMRQMLSQTIPQIISSTISVIGVFSMMVFYSVGLTLLTLVFVSVMFLVTRKIAKKSGGYFIKQQSALGRENGFIEEMLSGQKVVKVFCHEARAKARFRELNEELRFNASQANSLSNIIGPISNQVGYLQYIAVAFVAALLAMSRSVLALSPYGWANGLGGALFLILSAPSICRFSR